MANGPEEAELLTSSPDVKEGLKVFRTIGNAKNMIHMLDVILEHENVMACKFPREDLVRMRSIIKSTSKLAADMYEQYRTAMELLDEVE